jgi:membrane-bound serine protease (ClpP class)
MVDKDIALIRRDGEVIQLHEKSQIKSQDTSADEWITSHGKLLTLDAQQLMDFKVADWMLPTLATPNVTPLEMELGEWPASQSQLFAYPFFSKIPYATILYYSNWKIDFFAFLTSPFVASLLMMGLILGIYLEMSNPGFGLPGMMALTCLALILISNFAIETVHWLEVLLVVLGVFLLLAEFFVFPGFGLVGIFGILLILFGLVTSMLPELRSLHWGWNWEEWSLPTWAFLDRLLYYLMALVISSLIIAVLARFVTPRLLRKSRMILLSDQEGHLAGLKESLPQVGAEGKAFTSLHPGGKILIADDLYDALAEVGYIDKDEKVVVVKIQGSAIIVAKK